MNLKSLLKKRTNERSIITQFATIIGVTTFITLFFISSFNLYASVPIMNQVTVEKNRNNHAISNLILETFKSEYQQKKFEQTDKIAKRLISTNLIVFATIYDKKNKTYLWASIPNLVGLKENVFSPTTTALFKSNFEFMDKSSLKEINRPYGDYNLSTVFFNKDRIIPLINILFSGNLILAFLFIVFGFASALISAKIVTKPLKELVKGTEEFSKGNLSYRAKVLTNDEIGKLAKAFNLMAGNLDHLYESLELQVKERTAELADKKELVEKALREVQETQAMLIHNEKMTSLGQLVAGVAHELNNPINFIYGNLEHLKNYVNDLINLITIYQKNEHAFSDETKEELEKAKEDYDYLFIKEDLPSLIKSCKDGSERCKQIVLDLRNFSRLDEAVIKEVDLHEGLDSTLNILKNKYKNRINIHKNYGDIPKLNCYAGQLNQVFMNILDNASYAIKSNGDVTITTTFDEKYIIIIIKDSGEGISQELISKIFDPFFTTKPVGHGTGLGLSISYKVIKKHNGIIEVESQKDNGTKFTIKLPLNPIEVTPGETSTVK
jgi:signal transduction histidine kinase